MLHRVARLEQGFATLKIDVFEIPANPQIVRRLHLLQEPVCVLQSLDL